MLHPSIHCATRTCLCDWLSESRITNVPDVLTATILFQAAWTHDRYKVQPYVLRVGFPSRSPIRQNPLPTRFHTQTHTPAHMHARLQILDRRTVLHPIQKHLSIHTYRIGDAEKGEPTNHEQSNPKKRRRKMEESQ